MTVARQRPSTAKGIVFMLLEDEHGQVNLIVPSKVYERHRATVRAEPLILARGRYERVGENRNVLVSTLESLGPLARRVARTTPSGSRSRGRTPSAIAEGGRAYARVVSDVRFARSGDIDVAYRVSATARSISCASRAHTRTSRSHGSFPAYRRYYERIGEFARVILFDKRGLGMSDRVSGATTLEERMDDIGAVMDAVGSERAAVLGESEGGPLSILFAAAHPERTVGLILQGAEVRERKDGDWPWGEATDAEAEEYYAPSRSTGARAWAFDTSSPASETSEWGRAWLGRLAIHAATPASWEAFARMALRHRRAPRRALDQRADAHPPRGRRSGLSRRERPLPRPHDPGSKYVELPGGDHVPWFDPDRVLGEIREFLTGRGKPSTPDRILATVLFTDLVGSTALAAELGDRRWRELLEQHHASVRRELARFDGRRSTPRATASSRRSTGRRGRSDARGPSSNPCGRSASTCGPGCTRAKSSSRTARSRASP